VARIGGLRVEFSTKAIEDSFGNGHRGFLLRIITGPTARICPRQEKNPRVPAVSVMLEKSSSKRQRRNLECCNENNLIQIISSSGVESKGDNDILVSIHGVYA